jgi:hypothetical protein
VFEDTSTLYAVAEGTEFHDSVKEVDVIWVGLKRVGEDGNVTTEIVFEFTEVQLPITLLTL